MAHDHHNHGDHHGDHMVHHHRDVTGGAARAAVFGVSDGLVSNVALILGVAAASGDDGSKAVLVAGVAGLLAGAASMAAGEYVSVTAQKELVERELAIERVSIAERPEEEVAELTAIYLQRGLQLDQAKDLATAVMSDPEVALEVHAREELGVDPHEVGDPWGAAGSSFVAFSCGALVPLVPWFFAEGNVAVVLSIILGLVASAAVGWVLALFTERGRARSALRQVSVATIACGITWIIGTLLGAAIV